jgi:hypothetical protein
MSEPIVNPTAWLWQQLECILTPLQLAELRASWKVQSDRYGHAAKIHQVKREIASCELFVKTSIRPDYHQKRLDRRKARLAQLEADDAAT